MEGLWKSKISLMTAGLWAKDLPNMRWVCWPCDHNILQKCIQGFRGHHNASTAAGSDRGDRSTKWISHNHMVTYIDRQTKGERDSIQYINNPIHTHTHTHTCARLGSTVSSLLVHVFPHKCCRWQLLTHQHQGICLYYSGWQSMYFPEHTAIHLCVLDLFTAHNKPKCRVLVKAVHADGPVD